jgi:hypothetical protein
MHNHVESWVVLVVVFFVVRAMVFPRRHMWWGLRVRRPGRMLRNVVVGRDASVAMGRACPRSACREVNPWDARFCRRCGRTMEGAAEVKGMPPRQ